MVEHEADTPCNWLSELKSNKAVAAQSDDITHHYFVLESAQTSFPLLESRSLKSLIGLINIYSSALRNECSCCTFRGQARQHRIQSEPASTIKPFFSPTKQTSSKSLLLSYHNHVPCQRPRTGRLLLFSPRRTPTSHRTTHQIHPKS